MTLKIKDCLPHGAGTCRNEELIEELVAALKPFAYLAKVMDEGFILTHRGVYVTWEQAQAAAAAIAKAEPAP